MDTITENVRVRPQQDGKGNIAIVLKGPDDKGEVTTMTFTMNPEESRVMARELFAEALLCDRARKIPGNQPLFGNPVSSFTKRS